MAIEFVQLNECFTAVTTDGDVYAPGVVRGGSSSAPSLIEIQAAVDETQEQNQDAVRRGEKAKSAPAPAPAPVPGRNDARQAARSRPHTPTVCVTPAPHVALLRDFVAIGQTGNSVYTLCASNALGAKTLAEMIALAKAKPGALRIGSVGLGSTHHLIAEMLKASAGIELTHVP